MLNIPQEGHMGSEHDESEQTMTLFFCHLGISWRKEEESSECTKQHFSVSESIPGVLSFKIDKTEKLNGLFKFWTKLEYLKPNACFTD